MNNATTSSSNATVDDISNDIGRMGISQVVGDVSESNVSSKQSEESSIDKYTSCDQKRENTKTDYASHDNVDIDMVSEDVGSGIDTKEVCANCGKEGATNTCNKCKQVKYCNASCKKKHRHKHKKDCEEHLRLVAELQEKETKRKAELHDIALFKDPPQREDCPICFQRLPLMGTTGYRYQSCCGKVICSGCIYAQQIRDVGALCPFCRISVTTSNEENIKRLMKRVEKDDIQAITNLGFYYSKGMYGLPQDDTRALELFHQAVEFGHADAYFNVGRFYYRGMVVKMDKKKAIHYWELAAMGGYTAARHMLGIVEQQAGNMDRAVKHHVIAIEGGYHVSLEGMKKLYIDGCITKDDYSQALRAYQEYLVEVKSSQRDEAAAAREEYKYIG